MEGVKTTYRSLSRNALRGGIATANVLESWGRRGRRFPYQREGVMDERRKRVLRFGLQRREWKKKRDVFWDQVPVVSEKEVFETELAAPLN